jgi:hypothetical protein
VRFPDFQFQRSVMMIAGDMNHSACHPVYIQSRRVYSGRLKKIVLSPAFRRLNSGPLKGGTQNVFSLFQGVAMRHEGSSTMHAESSAGSLPQVVTAPRLYFALRNEDCGGRSIFIVVEEGYFLAAISVTCVAV